MTSTPPNGNVTKWVQWISSTILVPVIGALFVWIGMIQLDVVEIQANRYTSGDALQHSEDAATSLSAIWQELAAIRVAMAELPPDDFEKYVRSIDERLRNLEIETAANARK